MSRYVFYTNDRYVKQTDENPLDLQRAIRYLRYHAEEYGIANIENLSAAGYSGGGMTINIAVEKFYGDIQPNAFIVNGIDDQYAFLYENSYAAIQYYREQGVRYEAHIFSDAAHGLGNGFGRNADTCVDEDVVNVKVWPELADTFLQIQNGQLQNTTALSQH